MYLTKLYLLQNVICANVNITKSELNYNHSELYSQTDSKGYVNISAITVSDTLENTELNTLNPNDTSNEELLQAFCNDIANVIASYEATLVVPTLELDEYEEDSSGIAKGASIGVASFWIIVGIAVTTFKCTQSDDEQEQSTPRKEYVTPHGGIPASEIGLNYAPRTPNPLRANGSSDSKPSGPPLQYGLTPEICVIQADPEPSVTPQRVTTDI